MVKLYQEYRRELWEAFDREDLQAVDNLLLERPSLKGLNASTTTLLHDAIIQQCSAKVVRYLLDLGLDINARSKGDGINVLCTAAGSSSPEVVTLLLRRGAKIDISESYRNPLIAAIVARDTHTARILIRAGVDPNLRYGGRDALWFALRDVDPDMIELLIQHQSRGLPKVEAKLRKRVSRAMNYKRGWLSKARDLFWIKFGI